MPALRLVIFVKEGTMLFFSRPALSRRAILPARVPRLTALAG
jgi:hypothetical protein